VQYDPSWFPPVGAPNDLAVDNTNSGGCYERKFYTAGTLTGQVDVNGNASLTCSYTVPTGTWTDQFGNAVSGSPNLSAATGIVLVKH
jgi:hypothetical protein